MKYVKMLGLAAVAAAALMAFVGASTASASVLCTTEPSAGLCPTNEAYTGEIHAVTTEKPKLTSSFKTVECNESTLAGKATTEGNSTTTSSGPVEVLTFSGACNCTIVVAAKGTMEVHSVGDTGGGVITSNGATVTVSCSTIFGTVHCNYVTENDNMGEFAGGADPTITVTVNVKRESTSAICDEEAIWHAKYTITTPASLWVATATTTA